MAPNKTGMIKKCLQCGEDYYVIKSRIDISNFCSNHCCIKYRNLNFGSPIEYSSRLLSIIKGPRSEVWRRHVGESMKVCHKDPNSKFMSPEYKIVRDRNVRKLGKIVSDLWKDEEYRKRVIPSMILGWNRRPSSVECKFISFCEENNLPFVYVGDGKVEIGHKIPDFVDLLGKHICIEVGMKNEKTYRYGSPEIYAKKRVEHFAKYGWKCLVLWDTEFSDSISKIVELCEGVNNEFV